MKRPRFTNHENEFSLRQCQATCGTKCANKIYMNLIEKLYRIHYSLLRLSPVSIVVTTSKRYNNIDTINYFWLAKNMTILTL